MHLTLMTELLGGKRTIGQEVRTTLDLVQLARKGLPKSSLVHIAAYLGSPVNKLAELLPITERTIQRYAPKAHFTRVVSEQVLHLAEVLARGTEVFGERERFLDWLQQGNMALGGHTPRSLLDSRFGVEMVLDELGRIEHGVVS